jgi:peptide/nickel transport system substrate-binding protein
LRRNVRWQDGVPFTSRDVAFSYDAIMNKNNDVISRHGYDLVDRVTTPDPYTVVFHLRERFAPFIATVFGESDSPYGILPAHLLEKYSSLNDVPYDAAPVGTGPYKVVRWLRGDHIEFVANDDYFLGKPKIRRIVWSFVNDENTAILLLRTHQVDWFFEATAAAYKIMRNLPEVRSVLVQINGYNGIMLNSGRGPTADVRVRRAIAMAVDKERLTDQITGGSALVATGDLPPVTWAYDPRLHSLPYDRAAAARELAEAGYGPRHPLVLDLVAPQGDSTSQTLAVQLQAALRPLGIDVRPRFQLLSVFFAGYAANGTLARGNYEAGLYGWIAGIDPDDSSQLTCANRPPGGYNQSYYCSPEMDAAQAIALSHYDRATRKRAYATIERLVVDDAPLVILWWPRNIQGVSPALHGFDPNPINEVWDIRNWSLD